MAQPNPLPSFPVRVSAAANGDVYAVGGGVINIQLTGTWSAQVFFEGSPDWINWYTVLVVDPNTAAQVNNTTVNGEWYAPLGNYAAFRCRVANYVSGAIAIDLSQGGYPVPFQSVALATQPPMTSRDGGSASLTANGQSGGVITNGCATAVFQVSGTWVGTLSFQATGQDGTTFANMPAIRLDTAAHPTVYSTTTNGTFEVPCGGMSQVLCKFTAYTSGTAVVTAFAGVGPAALLGLAGPVKLDVGAEGVSTAVIDGGGTGLVPVGGKSTIISATLTRPANTTAYAAGDEMTDTGGAILTLTGIARAAGLGGTIDGIYCAVSSNAATKPIFDLYLYDTTSTPQTDNAAFAPSDAVQDTGIAVIPLASFSVGDATASTGNFQMDTGSICVPFLTSGSANLFLRAVVRAAYTAGTNSDTYRFRFRVTQY